MKSYTFCLYYEVQDSSNEDIDGFKKDNAFESGYSPIIFKSIEEAMSFRENPDFSMISNKYLDEETKYWNIRVFENKSAESPRNEETAQKCNCDKGMCVKSRNYYKFCKYTQTIVNPEYLHG